MEDLKNSNADKISIVVVEDDIGLNHLISSRIEDLGYNCISTFDIAGAHKIILNTENCFVLLDYSLGNHFSSELVIELLEKGIKFPYIVLTGYSDTKLAVDFMKLGAYDFLVKSESFLDEIELILNKSIDRYLLEKHNVELQISLQKSEKLFRLIADNMYDIVCIHNLNGDFEYVSPSVYNILGYKPIEIIGMNPTYYIHPEDSESFQDMVKESIKKFESWTIEYRFRTKKNEYIWVETTGTFIIDENKTTREIQTVTRNINDRIKAALKLKQSEKQFRAAFEYAAVGMSLRSLDGMILVANNALCEMLGYKKNELEGRSFTEFTFHEDLHLTASYIGKEPELKPYQVYKRYIHKNGSIVWASVSSNILTDENNNPLYFIAQIQNITEQKKAEELAKADDARIESLLRIYEHQSTDIVGLLEFALDEVVKLTKSKIGYIYYYDENTKQLTLNSWSKGVITKCLIKDQQTVFDLDKTGLWGEVVRQRKAILVNDFSQPNPLKMGYPDGHTLLYKYLSIPVTYNNKIVAVVGVANKEEDYNEKDIRQLTLMMDSVWEISVRKKTEFELAGRLEMEQLIAEISTEFVTNAIDNNNTAISFVLSKIGSLTNADRAFIYIANESTNVVNNTHEWYRDNEISWKNTMQNIKISEFKWWANKIYSGEIINISSIEQLPEEAINERKFLEKYKIKSQLFVPLIYAGKPIGILGVSTLHEKINWSTKDIDFLKTVSPIVASALNNFEISNALKHSEIRYRKLFDRLPDIIILHHDGLITYVNEAAITILGFPKNDFIGNSIFSFVPNISAEFKTVLLGKYSGSELGLKEINVRSKSEIKTCIVRTEIVTLDNTLLTLVLLSDITKRKELENNVKRNIDKQSVLNSMLKLTLENISLETMLENAFQLILGVPWLSLEQKGCLFLVDESGQLKMQTQRNLDCETEKKCSIVPFDQCLCGKTAVARKIVFSNHQDSEQEHYCNIITDHGHYCVPILFNNEVLGVINLYLEADHIESTEEKEFLTACTNTIAGLIARKGYETELQNTLDNLESIVDLRTKQIQEKNDLLLEEIEIRKQIESALSLSEEKFKTIVEQSVYGIYIGSHKGDFISVNNKGCELSGYSKDELLTMNISQLFTPEERVRVPFRYDLLDLGQTVINERVLTRKDGSMCFIEMSTRKMTDGTYQAIFRDITEKKIAEEEIKKALEKEQELNALKSRFISLVSHEFRTPLAGLLLSVELLEKYSEKWDLNKKKEQYKKIYNSIRYTNMLLDDVSLMGKDDLGKLECHASEFNLAELCYLSLEDAKALVKNSTIRVFVEIAEDLDKVFLDESLVRHIITNLLTNAFKYSPEKKNVHFKVEQKHDRIFILVSDEGIGIPDNELEKIFERFHRAQNVSNIKGTGLGLSIVKRSIELMSGDIRIQSKVGVGTTVYVELPKILNQESQAYEHN